jgi:hypothetical protein
VWVYICSPPPKGVSKKLVAQRYAGPYQVLKCTDSGVFYELANNENKRLPVKVHQKRMQTYIRRNMPPAVAPPPDDIHHAHIPADYYPSTDKVPLVQSVDTTDVVQPPLYEAEKIVSHSEDENGNLTYQVKWKNFGKRNNTSVAAEVIKDDMLIQEYWNKQHISSISYSQKSKTLINSVGWIWLILSLAILCGLTKAQNFRAWDCSKVVHRRVVRVDNHDKCQQPIKDTLMSSETFTATVKKFNTDITSFDIYNCNQFTAKLTCKETWYWSKSRKVNTKFEQISEIDCQIITQQALAGSHKFKKVKNNRWESRSHDKFECRWAKTTTRKYVHRTVSKYRAAVKGADQELIMGLSKTRCYHKKKNCNLKEDGSTLIWNLTDHQFRKLKVIGQFKVHKAREYYVIPKLRSGGHAVKVSTYGFEIQLTSGLIITRLPPRDPKIHKERPIYHTNFLKDALKYFKHFGMNSQLGIMGVILQI